MDRPQAQALAALVHALRPEWEPAGIMTALATARDRGDVFEVAQAAIYAASVKANRTPAVIPLAGEHWTRGRALGASGTTDVRFERCDKPGHKSFPAANCSACRSEDIASEGTRTDPRHTDPEHLAIYERGARRARAAIKVPTNGEVR
ncbi:MAG: hypothetical protein M0Z51_11075 [Propionibacterium sp.]|nr:hypothetical protein [Propionibacterium sp.]